jgi:hypothetical protein
MPGITMSQVFTIQDPTVKAVADEVVQTARVAAEKAAAVSANPALYSLRGGTNSFERIMSRRFAELSPARQSAAEANVISRLGLSQKTRAKKLGRFAKIDLTKRESVEEQAAALPGGKKLSISKAQLQYMASTPLPAAPSLGATSTILLPGAFPFPGTLYETPKLDLRLINLRCVDETGNPWFGGEIGADKINLGGSMIDATGVTTKINDFRVGEFDDGDVVAWNPLKSFAKFDLAKGTEWPKSYFVIFALAEIDQGGFPDFLNELVKKVADEIKKRLGAYIGGIIGAASGGVIGAIIGIAVGYAVDKIIEWLINIWKDDVFDPLTVSIELQSSRATFGNGSYNGPDMIARFKGHDGEYHLTFDWRLITGKPVVAPA